MTNDFNLTTKRLILRDYRSEDWAPMHVYASDPDFLHTKPRAQIPSRIESAQVGGGSFDPMRL